MPRTLPPLLPSGESEAVTRLNKLSFRMGRDGNEYEVLEDTL
jgi:hypothetical protein